MFRKTLALRAASLCGFLAAVVFFVIGLVLTFRFGRWDPYMKVDWQEFFARQRPEFGPDFFAHLFVALVAMGVLIFLVALGTRTFRLHPTSTAVGLGFLGVSMILMAIYSIGLAFGKDMVLLRYHGTEDEALRHTLQHLYLTGYLDTPVLTGAMALLALAGFALLGIAFRGQSDGGAQTVLCWLSAAGLAFATLSLGWGYNQTFAEGHFPRTLMLWGQVGLWLLPTITMGACASWLWRQGPTTVTQVETHEPPLDKAA